MNQKIQFLSRNLTKPLKSVQAKTALDIEEDRTKPTVVRSASPGDQLTDTQISISQKMVWIVITAETQIQPTQKLFGAISKVELQTTIMNTATQLVPQHRML
jgi:hypothetical protein